MESVKANAGCAIKFLGKIVAKKKEKKLVANAIDHVSSGKITPNSLMCLNLEKKNTCG